MTRTNVSKFLWSRLLYTFSLSALTTVLIVLISASFLSGGSSGMEANEGITLGVLIGIGVVMVLSLSSLTVFFNLDPAIAGNRWYSGIAYFFLPLSAAVSFVIMANSIADKLAVSGIFIVPFFVVHIYFYLQFRKRVITGDMNK